MYYDNYRCLKIRLECKVAFITIDNPPINLLDMLLLKELNRIGKEIEKDDRITVAVFQSANPDFFMAHADVGIVQDNPREAPSKPTFPNGIQMVFDRFRTMPKITIGKIEGRARGGGSELLMALDMRFGAVGRTILSQPEVAFGIIPGAGGTQNLAHIIGRGRALEVVLGCQDFTTEIAERYGYINRALPPEDLTPFVDNLAFRIASFPAEVVALAKASVNSAELTMAQGLLEEADCFNKAVATGESIKRIKRFLELGGQTHDKESGSFEDLIAHLSENS